MGQDTIIRAWLWLLALSIGSTVAALVVNSGTQATIAGSIILLLAWAKSRIILAQYLGLAQAPAIKRGFNMVMTLFMLTALGLFLIPAL